MTAVLAERIDGIAAAAIRPDGPRSAVFRLEVPGVGFAHATAAGVARGDSPRPADVDDRFHVASVGKMFTAVLVTAAAADGRFGPNGIDTTLGQLELLPGTWLDRLHPQAASVTLRHLLTHTSGMKDAVTDDATGTAAELGHPAPESLVTRFARSVGAHRRGTPDDGFARHRWTPWDPERPDEPMAGILNRFVASGTAASPVGAPGERFHYSDTAYVLLGVLLELATGRSYHDLQREEILDPLGMRSTYLAYRDDPSPAARNDEMDVWFGDVPLLSEGFDLSFDWAGGGQVSTATDLVTLLQAVLAPIPAIGAPSLPLTGWSTPPALEPPRRAVGLGLFRWDAGRRVVVGHAGAWGVRVFHDPTTGAWLAGTVNRQDPCTWMAEIFDAVEEELS